MPNSRSLFNLIIALLMGVFLFSSNAYSFCRVVQQLNPLEEITHSTQNLVNVVEYNKKRVDLMESNITYGIARLGVGKAQIYITTKNDQIVDLNVFAEVGVLGMNSIIQQRITLDQLINGQALSFKMEGGDRGILTIVADPGMTDQGGWATLKVWNGKRYLVEKINISKRNGKFRVYKNTIKQSNEIIGLDIQMRGMSIPKMYVNNFKVKTRG